MTTSNLLRPFLLSNAIVAHPFTFHGDDDYAALVDLDIGGFVMYISDWLFLFDDYGRVLDSMQDYGLNIDIDEENHGPVSYQLASVPGGKGRFLCKSERVTLYEVLDDRLVLQMIFPHKNPVAIGASPILPEIYIAMPSEIVKLDLDGKEILKVSNLTRCIRDIRILSESMLLTWDDTSLHLWDSVDLCWKKGWNVSTLHIETLPGGSFCVHSFSNTLLYMHEGDGQFSEPYELVPSFPNYFVRWQDGFAWFDGGFFFSYNLNTNTTRRFSFQSPLSLSAYTSLKELKNGNLLAANALTGDGIIFSFVSPQWSVLQWLFLGCSDTNSIFNLFSKDIVAHFVKLLIFKY